ncbi:MAG: hypothetical protein AAF483_18255 [Planctomycetota bacterium]
MLSIRSITIITCACVCSLQLEASDWQVQAKLSDGSVIFGSVKPESLSIHTDTLSRGPVVPSDKLQSIENSPRVPTEVMLTFIGGDRLTGKFALPHLKLETEFGTLQIPVSQIENIERKGIAFGRKQRGPMQAAPDIPNPFPGAEVNQGPAVEAPTSEHSNLKWEHWRTDWAFDPEQNRFTALGKVRPGFNYGHGGAGRGGMTITGNGDKTWRNYEVEFDFKMLSATKDFFHASIPGESRGMHVYLRCKSMTESWNEPDTAYVLGVNTMGGWSIAAYEGFGYRGPGWTPEQLGKVEHYIGGEMEGPFQEVNRLRVRVEDSTISIWMNDEQLGVFEHPEDAEIAPIEFGGFGVEWRFESLGWIGNIQHKKLGRRE